MKRLNKGFTLIELLVVVGIIGILATVVLVSLNDAKNKGGDAGVKSNLSSIRSSAEVLYNNNIPNNYANLCTNTPIANGMSAAAKAHSASITVVTLLSTAQTATTVNCHLSADNANWAISAPLKTSGYWCVDNTGVSAKRTTLLGANVVACPAS